jgi:hypothetical protein
MAICPVPGLFPQGKLRIVPEIKETPWYVRTLSKRKRDYACGRLKKHRQWVLREGAATFEWFIPATVGILSPSPSLLSTARILARRA